MGQHADATHSRQSRAVTQLHTLNGTVLLGLACRFSCCAEFYFITFKNELTCNTVQHTQEKNSIFLSQIHTHTLSDPAIFSDCVIDVPIDVPYGLSLRLWPNVSIQQCVWVFGCCFVSVLHQNVCVWLMVWRTTRLLMHVYGWTCCVSICLWMCVFQACVWPSVIDYRQGVIGIITLLSGGLSQRHSAPYLNTAQTSSEMFDVLTCALNSNEIWMTYQTRPWWHCF